jgi:cob(I)alamin adenosyltransferase
MAKIYTRTGDKGKTSLFDGTRVLKSSKRVETYGTVDELNSLLGNAISQLKNYSSSDQGESRSPSTSSGLKHSRQARTIKLKKEMEKIQHDLFEVGSALAVPHAMPVNGLETRPKDFEVLIDWMTEQLPELKQFILPGGGKAGAAFHVCRTVARRAERQVVSLMEKEDVDINILIYLNRLSDLFFTVARFVNHLEKKKEVVWKKR